jgi:hypothetical protein
MKDALARMGGLTDATYLEETSRNSPEFVVLKVCIMKFLDLNISCYF